MGMVDVIWSALEWRWRLFKDWLGPRAKSIDDLVDQGKVICHVSIYDEKARQYILARRLVAAEQAIWDNFQATPTDG